MLTRKNFLMNSGLLAAGLYFKPSELYRSVSQRKFYSNSGGVLLGANVPYSIAGGGGVDAKELLEMILQVGLDGIELRSDVPEIYSGAPEIPRFFGRPSTDQQEQLQKVKTWRETSTSEKFEEFRKLYEDAGVQIFALRHNNWSLDMPDWEIDYVFNMAKSLGANHITLEMPNDDGSLTDRIGRFAQKHQMLVGYHNHAATEHFWDRAIWQSNFNGLNLDVGHYFSSTGLNPIELMEKYWDRIGSLHIKDRKANNGDNVPFGEGDTPLKDILLLMKERQASFPAIIELEYSLPENSDKLTELKKCLSYCEDILG